MSINIRKFAKKDWTEVKEIYQLGIATGNATLEAVVPAYETWVSSGDPACTFVAYTGQEGSILGWCRLAPASTRKVYEGVAEVSVYVHPAETGKGIGGLLLEKLIQASEQKGYWTLTAGILVENTSSISLHKKHGFKEIGVREKIGSLHGVWRDVLLLERRSRIVNWNTF
ncbi:GNAT family N-acetyltransferase [Halobacillus naozhouensis]|uniref:GNAT family N-acetyltransferase n=1 Tax=Halobacillus naozhouensis TaxID=554880 RepID=A0ABY8J114_9BACI|nr:GNAT family N-acetyltransferase [Halobacillus naozhouensis]WFT75098.1 GNAT family N-acetyltransferase [Halobacillus naozhouensis]